MDYQVDLSRPQNKFGIIHFRVLKDGKEVHAWQAHQHSVFTTSGDTLVVADFHPNRHGCGLVAFDLKNKKDLWQTELKGIGPIPHSRYSNRVNLDLVDGAVRVFSQESAGRYVEFVDPKTGKTLGHKVYPK